SAAKAEVKKTATPAKAKTSDTKVQKQHLQKLESQIELLEREKSLLEIEMAKEDFYKHHTSKSVIEKYGAVSAQLESLYREWEKVFS
ncbi:MAG: hypothetical protein ACK42Y_09720, partial [Candidatus Thermochlorobacter sp.]